MSNLRQGFELTGLALPHVAGLRAYTPGLQPGDSGWTKLNTNENPYPPSPKVEAAIRAVAGELLRKYPDPKSSALRAAIARHHGLRPENVCVGNGSDDILNLLTRLFCGGERAAGFSVPGYSLYPVLAAIQNGQTVTLDFDRSMKLDIGAAAGLRASVLFFTTPNAPTGVGFPNAVLEKLLRAFRGLVVADEAYADFAPETAVELLAAHPNLCVTRTFSKSYGLAGLRVGYALGSPELIDMLDRVRDSYNVNRLSQAGAMAALEDQDYFQAVVEKIKKTRDEHFQRLMDRSWFTYPSAANFLFTEPRDRGGRSGPEVAKSLYDFLYRGKVLVRYFPSHVLTRNFLRISVGSEAEMSNLSATIEQWLKTG